MTNDQLTFVAAVERDAPQFAAPMRGLIALNAELERRLREALAEAAMWKREATSRAVEPTEVTR